MDLPFQIVVAVPPSKIKDVRFLNKYIDIYIHRTDYRIVQMDTQ